MVCSPLFLPKLGYLVEEIADLCVKRTLIDPCWHKAVRISVRKTLLHHASVRRRAPKIVASIIFFTRVDTYRYDP
jgi:hypothetical protein